MVRTAALHEAGHATAAITLGLPLIRASIIDWAVDCSSFLRDLAIGVRVTFVLSGGEAERASGMQALLEMFWRKIIPAGWLRTAEYPLLPERTLHFFFSSSLPLDPT